MTEAFALAQKLGSIGFPALLVLIIYGSYKGIWVWGRQLRKVEEESAEWKSMALRLANVSETLGTIAKTTTRGSV